MPDAAPYRMTLSLNVLNHLGINLYSNVPAVLSEVVANSWDADAESVDVDVDSSAENVTITDDGQGMTLDEINAKYLNVGYRRREKPEEAVTPKFRREVMGRKGIGKLSLFSIAKKIEVHTVRNGVKNGFRMAIEDIEALIAQGSEAVYNPTPVDSKLIHLTKGTRIILTDLKKSLQKTEGSLRKRLARRFSIIGEEHHFSVRVSGQAVTIDDRDYFHKLQYIWYFDEASKKYVDQCKKLQQSEKRSGDVGGGDLVTGWIGTVRQSGELKDGPDNLNKIVVMVRGKVAQEDILEDFNEGGIYTKYLIGEIHADFLDSDAKPDIATTSRQRIVEDDPRYAKLRAFVFKELKNIENSWTSLRNKAGVRTALQSPTIRKWFEGLRPDLRARAESLFGKINQLTIESEDDRRQLFKHAIIAFESLRYKENLDALETVSADNLEAVTKIVAELDDIEGTLYHQIVSERIKVIEAFQEKVEGKALEKIIQQHVFDHLWLLDPSWERATDTPYMEQSVSKEFGKIDAKLTTEERAARLDIKYKTVAGKHVIIELKRADRVVGTADLLAQATKYINALRKVLKEVGRDNEPVEVVCIVGEPLSDWVDERARAISVDTLRPSNIRVVMYQELIQNAYKAYQAFLDKHGEAGRIYALIRSIEAEKIEAPAIEEAAKSPPTTGR
jgi:hypothetical protein